MGNQYWAVVRYIQLNRINSLLSIVIRCLAFFARQVPDISNYVHFHSKSTSLLFLQRIMSMHDTLQLADHIHFHSRRTSLFLQIIMSVYNTLRLVNIYHCFFSLRMSVFHTYVFIGVYICHVPSLFVRHRVVTIKLTTRAISDVTW